MARKLTFDNAISADIQTASSDSFIDNLKMIDVNKITPSDENFYTMSEIEALADDIERQGIMSVLVVSDSGNDNYILISGHRRLAAVKLLIENGRRKCTKVPCYLKGEKSKDETQLDLIMMNATQRKYTDTDTMHEYEELNRIFAAMDAAGKPFKGRMRENIAKALNVSPAQVGKLDNIKHNAIDEVEQAVKSGEMSISTANEIAKLAPEKQKELIEEKPDISHKEVKEIQKQEQSPKEKEQKAAASKQEKKPQETSHLSPAPVEEDTDDESEDVMDVVIDEKITVFPENVHEIRLLDSEIELLCEFISENMVLSDDEEKMTEILLKLKPIQ